MREDGIGDCAHSVIGAAYISNCRKGLKTILNCEMLLPTSNWKKLKMAILQAVMFGIIMKKPEGCSW